MIPTTILTKIPNTKLATIPTTFITTIPNKTPAKILTTYIKPAETTIITTIPKIISTSIPTTIIQEQCKYGILINYTSLYSNISNEDIYDNEIPNILKSYCSGGSSVIIKGQKNKFQITTTKNELRVNSIVNNINITSLDLTECENILKEQYQLGQDVELIILKFLSDDEETIQYEIYEPFTHKKLNLSYCENSTVYAYIPTDLDENILEIYNNLIEQGYYPLDLNDKFYREICTPYRSENGTDVLLDDREEFIFTSLANLTICPSGCNYLEYVFDKKYIKCECEINTTGIETLDIEHLSGKNIGKSILSTLKATNWKVIICYNLVFNFQIFYHNLGSILILILFFIYIIFMIYFCIKDITPLKIQISKILFNEVNEDKKIHLVNYYGKITGTKKNQKENYPPKKGKKHDKNGYYSSEKKIKTEENSLIISTRKERSISKKNTKVTIKSSKKVLFVNKEKEINIQDKEEDEKEVKKILDHFELNNLDYDDAYHLDKRSCFRTYYWYY